MRRATDRRQVVVHLGVLLNLSSCRCAPSILEILSWDLLLPQYTFSRLPTGSQLRQTVMHSGLVQVVPFMPVSSSTLVTCCNAGLRDADAHVVALAAAQKSPLLLTDDRRVIGVARQCAPQIHLRDTIGLLKYGFEQLRMSQEEIDDIVKAMRQETGFVPLSDS